jgi:hypothetical protein
MLRAPIIPRPGNLRVGPMKGLVQFAGGFTNDRDVPAYRIHDQRIRRPFGAAGGPVFGDAPAGVPDVHDVDERIFRGHKLKRYGLVKNPVPNIGMDAAGLD